MRKMIFKTRFNNHQTVWLLYEGAITKARVTGVYIKGRSYTWNGSLNTSAEIYYDLEKFGIDAEEINEIAEGSLFETQKALVASLLPAKQRNKRK